MAEMLRTLAQTFYENGEYSMARSCYIQLMDADEGVQFYKTSFFLAKCSYYLGFNHEALTILSGLYEAIREKLNDDSGFLMDVQNALGNALIAEKRYGEALECFRRMEAVDAKNGVTLDDNALVVKRSIALCLNFLDKFQESYDLYQQISKREIELHGTEHPRVKQTKADIAMLLTRMGKPQDALNMMEAGASENLPSSDDIQRKVLQVNNLNSLGKYEEALKINFEVLNLVKSTYHEKHPMMLAQQVVAIFLLFDVKMFDEAMQMGMDTMKLHKEVYGPKNPKSMIAYETLAECYKRLNKHEQALEVLKEAQQNFKGIEEVLTDYISIIRSIAQILHEMNRTREALSTIDLALAEMKQSYDEDHDGLPILKFVKGKFLSKTGNYSDAVKILREVEAKTKNSDETSKTCKEARKILFSCYVNLNELNQSLEIYSKLVDIDIDDHDLTKAKNKLANKLADAKQNENALRVFKEVEKIMQAIGLSPHNGALLNTKQNIGAVLEALGRNQEAKSYFSYVERVKKQTNSN